MKPRTIFLIVGGLATIWALVKVAELSDTAKRLENRVNKPDSFFGNFFKPVTETAKAIRAKANSLFSSANDYFIGGTGGTGGFSSGAIGAAGAGASKLGRAAQRAIK